MDKQEIINKIDDVRKIQGTDGNWDRDEYMRGMYNGIELCFAIATDKEPVYKESEAQDDK